MHRKRLKVTKSILLSITLPPFLFIAFCSQAVKADEKNIIACWTFDRVIDNRIEDDAGHAVQSTTTPGAITLTATAPGLKSGSARITSIKFVTSGSYLL